MGKKDIDYKNYLKLPEILTAQTPVSGAHDEMLFIIVHQTYELWFKQILFELDRVQGLFTQESVADKDLRVIAAALDRTNEILRHLVRQIDVLETMAPLDFLEFRHVFRSASGFQSIQFRLLETRLGLRDEDRISYGGITHESFLDNQDRQVLTEVKAKPSLFAQLDNWLSRTPFVDMGGFNFQQTYRKAVEDMIAADQEAIQSAKRMTEDIRKAELKKLENTRKVFNQLFDDADAGHAHWRMSGDALHAALLITLYRDQPALQQPYHILSALKDMDEIVTLWRYRHALMVQRMLGVKMGSGGSSGHDYLMETIQKHRIFTDLFALSAFLIPRSKLPELPKDIEEKMGFIYAA